MILAYIHRSSRNVTSERARHTSRVALVVSEAAKRGKGIGADGGDASANTRDLALHDLADGATVAERLVRLNSSDRELARRICIRMEMGVRLCLRGGSAPLAYLVLVGHRVARAPGDRGEGGLATVRREIAHIRKGE